MGRPPPNKHTRQAVPEAPGSLPAAPGSLPAAPARKPSPPPFCLCVCLVLEGRASVHPAMEGVLLCLPPAQKDGSERAGASFSSGLGDLTLSGFLPPSQSEPEGFSHFHLYVCAAFLIKWRKEILDEEDFQVRGLSSACAGYPSVPSLHPTPTHTHMHTYPSTEKCKLFAVWPTAHLGNIFTMYNMFALTVFSEPCYNPVG